MTKKFNGTINLDIRDSVPDWEPYIEPKAPEGSPNILYVVFDDTGFGAWEMFGGKIKMPNLKRIADRGLVYTNFHTTALCSPTRSSLLNGRNATSNGMACIEEGTTGFPGGNGRIPFENALIPEVLHEKGWNTFALGKWHLLPREEANMAANKRNWPLGRGFERYYGFLGGESDQWYPDLVYDNHQIHPPYEPKMEDSVNGYHLSKDLTDKAISFIQDTRAVTPDKPWMMYFCPGANHAPHQIWPEKILDYGYNTTLEYNSKFTGSFENTSVFKDGYEAYRKEVLANMKELGIFGDEVLEPSEINPHGEGVLEDNLDAPIEGVPEGKKWPQTDYVKPWDDLDGKEKALFVRMAEIYAAFSTYTDEQIGRLLDYLEETGEMDNTIIIAVSDNGASAEGGPSGSVNENLFFNDIKDDVENNFKLLDQLGTDETYNHYPTGWAWGFDTPFKYWKRWSGYEGGAATPFMICGPGIETTSDQSYEYRKQYVHAVDVVPTLYEMMGIEPPEVVKGYTQNPIEGVSFAYTFAPNYALPQYQFPYKLPEAQRPQNVKETQFYAMLGTRGIWDKGWHACTLHAPTPSDWSNFDQDTWELYCMDGDDTSISLSSDTYPIPADVTQSTNLVGEEYLQSLGANRAKLEPQLKQKLQSMINLWFLEAGKCNGLPLDDRSAVASTLVERPSLNPPPFNNDPNDPDHDAPDAIKDYTYYPGGSEIPEAVAPDIRYRSYEITATVNFSSATLKEDDGGVLLAQGGRFGGHSLYIHNKKLCYVYNWLGQSEQKVSCDLGTPTGEMELKVKFIKSACQGHDADLDSDKYGSSTLGTVELYINDVLQSEPTLELGDGNTWSDDWGNWAIGDQQFITQPGNFALTGEGLNIGQDGGQSVSHDYDSPGEFKVEGAILKKVVVTITNNTGEVDRSKELAGMLWRD